MTVKQWKDKHFLKKTGITRPVGVASGGTSSPQMSGKRHKDAG